MLWEWGGVNRPCLVVLRCGTLQFTGLRNNLCWCSNLSFVVVVDQMINGLKELEITIFFTNSMMIWNKRNEAQLGAPRPDPASLARKTTAHALEYVETNFGSLTWVPDIFCCFVLYRNFFFFPSLSLFWLLWRFRRIYCWFRYNRSIYIVASIVGFSWRHFL